jgi:hypothetical protein
LNRRELIDTAGYDPNTGDTEDTVDGGGVKRRLFASLMVMFAGFDLLAKFQLGDGGPVGGRFIEFLRSEDGGQMTRTDAALFYAVRCSLLHAFGTPDPDALLRLGLTKVALAQRKEGTWGGMSGMVLVESNGDTAMLYIDGVFRTYKNAIAAYHNSLFGQASGRARAQFEPMFDKYGTIGFA